MNGPAKKIRKASAMAPVKVPTLFPLLKSARN
jgi:hypothetical protein